MFPPDDLENAVQVRFDLLHGLRKQPAVGSHTHVGHPVDSNKRLQQPSQRVGGGVARL